MDFSPPESVVHVWMRNHSSLFFFFPQMFNNFMLSSVQVDEVDVYRGVGKSNETWAKKMIGWTCGTLRSNELNVFAVKCAWQNEPGVFCSQMSLEWSAAKWARSGLQPNGPGIFWSQNAAVLSWTYEVAELRAEITDD